MPNSPDPWAADIARLDSELALKPGDLPITLARAKLHESRALWLLERGQSGREELLAAMRDFVPTGVQFTEFTEAQERQESFNRCFELQRELSSDGRRRGSLGVEAKAESNVVDVPESATTPVPHAEKLSAEAPTTARPPVVSSPQSREVGKSPPPEPVFRNTSGLLLSPNQWFNRAHGRRCEELGDELIESEPGLARLCYEQAERNYSAYHRAWEAHLPASRWDSDGGSELCSIDQKLATCKDVALSSATDWRTLACRGAIAAALTEFAALAPEVQSDPARLRRDCRLHALLAFAALEVEDRVAASWHFPLASAGWALRASTANDETREECLQVCRELDQQFQRLSGEPTSEEA